MRLRFPSVATAVAAFALVVACTERQQVPGIPTEPTLAKGGPGVKSVNVTPSSASIAVNGTVQLTATASPPKAATGFTWSTSNAAVATVSASGLVTGVAAGTATIRATSGGATGASIVTVTAPPPPSNDPVLVGAGDIAKCSVTGDEATAPLLDDIAGTVFTLGDNVYDNGTATEFTNCYDPTWGVTRRARGRAPATTSTTRPARPATSATSAPRRAIRRKGYYSYDLGAWHVIVLNSNSSCTTIGCAAGSAQEQWLRADLAAHPNVCTLAYWHHPRFSSGAGHGNDTAVSHVLGRALRLRRRRDPHRPRPHLRALRAADTERGRRTRATASASSSSAPAAPATTTSARIKPNSQVRDGDTYGVLKLTLHAASYDWQFVPVAGATFTDSGTGSCH